MAPRAPPPRRTQLPSWVSPALQAALRRGAVAVHVAFAAAGFHALGYGLVADARFRLPLHVERLQSAAAANGAALLLAGAAAAFALPRLQET